MREATKCGCGETVTGAGSCPECGGLPCRKCGGRIPSPDDTDRCVTCGIRFPGFEGSLVPECACGRELDADERCPDPACLDTTATRAVLDEVAAERHRQHAQWGRQDLPDGTGQPGDRDGADSARKACVFAAAHGGLTYRHILDEEVAEAFAESDPARLRSELLQVAAVAVQWVEEIDRRAKEATDAR